MDSDDNASVATASTDTSMFIRELQALNSESSTGPMAASQSVNVDSLKVTASGDGGDSETLPQAMKLIKGERPRQIINLLEHSDEASIAIDEVSSEVDIIVSPPSSLGENYTGRNKVKIAPMVNHVWDVKYHSGNLVAVHRDTYFLAYVLRGRSGGIVRVVSRKTANRSLLKGFTGAVTDIAFALSSDVYLAAVDEGGNLFVYSFIMGADSIISHLVVHIEKETYNIESEFRNLTRVIWCPYMPEDCGVVGMDPAKMLVLLHGTQAEVWNTSYVCATRGTGPHSSKNIDAGVVCIEAYEPLMPVVNAAFAPDGSAIAVAYHSGIIRFFIVDLEGDSGDPECMYDWNPHDGCPVSSLYFLDNHKYGMPDQQLWKFALTGAKHNTEIKIWSCETWACVQTVHFKAPPSEPEMDIQMKAEIDLTSKYLILSDINSKVLYILQLHQNVENSTAHVGTLSEFSLAQPCLSFAIWEANLRRVRTLPDSHLDEITTGELEDDDEDEDLRLLRNPPPFPEKVTQGVQIKMYGVHNKSLHDMLIRYRPIKTIPVIIPTRFLIGARPKPGLKDMLSDVSMDPSEASNDLSNSALDSSHPALVPPQTFSTSSPSAPKPNNVSDQAETSARSISSTSSFTQVTGMNEDLLIESPMTSVDPSAILSPSSIFSQTPSKPNPTPHSSLGTESEFPLPPPTPGEEESLATTPKNTSATGGSGGSSFGSAKNSSQSLDASTRSNQSNQEILEMFSSWQSDKKTTPVEAASMESTSSPNPQDERYDENDHEVAQAMEGTFQTEGFDGEKEDAEQSEGKGSELEAATSAEEKKEMVWPEPPDVSTEAKRLVNEAIQQGTEEQEDEGKLTFDEDDENDTEIEEIIQPEGDEDADEEDGIRRNFQQSNARSKTSEASVQALSQLNTQISNLTQQMAQQQEMLLMLQKELTSQRDIQLQLHRQQIEHQQLQQVATQQPSIEKDISKLEDLLISRMEHSLAHHMQRETQRLQDSLVKSDGERQMRDKSLHTGLLAEVARSVKDTVSNTLRTEVKQTVNPALHRFVEPMKDKIHQEVAQRLSACDTLLRENISKAVKSRSTMDVLASSIGEVIYQQMQQAYSHTFKRDMLPSFKSAMEKTVRDVHGIFQQGTKEYQLYLRQNVEVMVRERGAMEDIIRRIESVESQFIQSVTHMKGVLVDSVREELNGQVSLAMGSLREEMMSDVRKILREEMSSALKEQGASISNRLTTYLRSGAATPVPTSSEEEISKEKIQREIRAGRINEAFQSALTAGNLDLVVYTCESVSPHNIFGAATCPLTQPVLLSLISQLCVNLDKHFELKMRFLSDAVMSLDPSQSTTAEHFPTVLGSFVQRLRATEAQGVDARKAKDIRMLVMAANSLVS